MTARRISIRGEVYLTLETVAECYRVEASWVREVYELGLLGRGESVGGATAVQAAMLERIARILHLHRQLGVNLPGVAAILGEALSPEGSPRDSGAAPRA